jgi:hypothetical protein
VQNGCFTDVYVPLTWLHTCACRWYVIYRVLTEQPERTVIFASTKSREGFVIPPNGHVRYLRLCDVDLTTIKRMRDIGPNPLLIADSMLPPVLRFPTLVVSSPGRLSDRNLNNTLNSYWGVALHAYPYGGRAVGLTRGGIS